MQIIPNCGYCGRCLAVCVENCGNAVHDWFNGWSSAWSTWGSWEFSAEASASTTTVAFLDSLYSTSSESRQALLQTSSNIFKPLEPAMAFLLTQSAVLNKCWVFVEYLSRICIEQCIIFDVKVRSASPASPASGDCGTEALPILGMWVASLRGSWHLPGISRAGLTCWFWHGCFVASCGEPPAMSIQILLLQAVVVDVPQQTNNFDCGIYAGASLCRAGEHGEHMVNTWWTHGEHMVNTWWTHGEHMVNTWWTHGEHSVTWDLWSLNVKLCRCWSLCHLAFAGRWKMLDPEFCSFLIKVGPNCPNWSKLNLSTFILRICICNYLHIFCILYTIYLSYCTVPLTASLACSTLAVLSRSWVWAEVTYHDQVLCNTIRATFTINWSMALAIDGVYDRVCQPDGYLGRS